MSEQLQKPESREMGWWIESLSIEAADGLAKLDEDVASRSRHSATEGRSAQIRRSILFATSPRCLLLSSRNISIADWFILFQFDSELINSLERISPNCLEIVSQLTAAISGLIARINCNPIEPEFLVALSHIGVALGIEGLLTPYRTEAGMWSDMVVAIEDLSAVSFLLVPVSSVGHDPLTRQGSIPVEYLPVIQGTREALQVLE